MKKSIWMLVFLLGLISIQGVLGKTGTCPKPKGYGPCIELCFTDDDCKGSQKCVGKFHLQKFFSLFVL